MQAQKISVQMSLRFGVTGDVSVRFVIDYMQLQNTLHKTVKPK